MQLKKRLLSTDPPLVGRLDDQYFQIDTRTLEEDEFRDVVLVLREALQECGVSSAS